MTKPSARDKLTEAAFALFDEQGYEQTTVDDIAARAGVGRTTVFRSFQSKEELIFPDHAQLLRLVAERLAASTSDTAMLAIREATRLVLVYYLDEGERARSRYRLTSTIPALRAREIASAQRYQRVFRQFLLQQLAGRPHAALRSEVMAAAVVAAHNLVLRGWLRGSSTEPVQELDEAMTELVHMFGARTADPSTAPATPSVIVLQTAADLETLLPSIRALLTS